MGNTEISKIIHQSSFARAVFISIVALIFFDLMGLVIKLLSSGYSALELATYRNMFGLIPAVIALWFSPTWHQHGRPLRTRQWPLLCSRGLIVTLAQFMFYLSLARIDFATATTISYSGALFMTAFAVFILGESVGRFRWMAVLIGFLGVLMVTGLGKESFTLNALLPVGASALYALTGVTARLVDEDVPSGLVTVYSSVSALLCAIFLTMIYDSFSPIKDLVDFGWLTLMGLFGGIAVLCLVVSYRMTEQSNLAPFSYFGIPIAFVLGWMFFGEKPFSDIFPGSILIVLGGLIVVWRERTLQMEEDRG